MKKIFISLVVTFSALSLSTPAQAAEKGWRYWGYFQTAPSTAKWVMANTGPSMPLVDGAVEGWVFTLSSKNISVTMPSIAPKFASICRGVAKRKDLLRIGLVIDYGNPLIAPKGEKPKRAHSECAEVVPGSTGLDLLKQNFTVRQSAQGFICGINKFPSNECSAEIVVPKALLKK